MSTMVRASSRAAAVHTDILFRSLAIRLAIISVFSVFCTGLAVAADDDLNVYMMEATVKLQGKQSLGTGFFLMRPLKVQDGPKGSISGKVVLVTAAHVLENMPEDHIVVSMRSSGPGETWVRHASILQIRRSGKPLWFKHPDEDVAVMYVIPDIPPFRKAPTVDLLATDEMLERYAMTPGMNLKCLGFPLGREANETGFPILRTGDIASYPLLPTATTKTFMMDFRVFKGNSGGPVYFSQPQFRGGVSFGGRAQFIMGLLSREAILPIQNVTPYESSVRELQLMIGIVVHARIIRDAIESLPAPESAESSQISVHMQPAR